ncbi:MAG: glycosyltransferase family 4 protein [Alphaproteobacteria bacterium]
MRAAAESGDPNTIVKPSGRRGRRVLIIQMMIRHYRQAFYEGLQAELAQNGVTLRVAYSLPEGRRALSNDDIPLDPSIGAIVPLHRLIGDRLVYQSVWKQIFWADLVIVDQGTRFVVNTPLVLASVLGLKRLGFWGHGWNHELGQGSLSERLKRFSVPRCDWWFAYTQGVARYVAERGMDPKRITVVENTVDTSELMETVAGVSEADLAAFRSDNGIPDTAKLAVFSGALYERKRIPFLIETAKYIKARLPEFHLAVIGEGPDAALVKTAARDHDWIHHLGATFGKPKAVCYRLADAFLCPGLVGLAILDALAASLPFITTDLPIHSPEIEYLVDGVNGLCLPYDVAAYGDAVAALLADRPRLETMKEAAGKSAQERPMSRMVNNFSQGILKSLGV